MSGREDDMRTEDLLGHAPPRDPDEREAADAERNDTPRADPSAPGEASATDGALMGAAEAERYRGRWSDVQASFVDEPQRAVADADGLVAEVIRGLAEAFSRERSSLEAQWSRGDEVSTEELRKALQRYRSFFDRLLAS